MPQIEPSQIRPVKALFQDREGYWHNAVLDQYSPSWVAYAEGYRLAGDAVVAAAQASHGDLNCLVYPTVFLYRQYLELSLKLIIYYVHALRDEEWDVPGTHDLSSLWDSCAKGVAEVSDGSLRDHCDVVDSAIRQFIAVDPTSFQFRYPVDKQGNPVRFGIERVNVLSLREEMANVAIAADVITGGLSARLDIKNEFAHESGQEGP